MEQDEKLTLPFMFVNALRHAQQRFKKHPHWKRLEGTPWENDAAVIGADLMSDVARTYEARITELEALVAESREVLGMFKSVRFEDGEQLARIDLGDNRCVQFRGGEGFFGNEVFFIATLRAAALSTKLEAQG